MTTLSVCIIAKNEAQCIANALNSIKMVADEIIVVETGSTDATKEIAEKFSAKIFDFAWNNNFADARNFSLQKATSDWILVLDADELIAEEDHEKIKKLMEEKNTAVYSLTQREYTNDATLTGFQYNTQNNTQKTKYAKSFLGFIDVFNVLRLFRNNLEIRFHWKIHESIAPSLEKLGLIPQESGVIIHHYKNEKNTAFQKEKILHYLKIGEEQIKETPQNPKPYYEAGLIYYSLGRYKDALSAFLKVSTLNPAEYRVYPRIALCWAKLGNPQKAIETYKKYLTVVSNDADVYGQLGLLYVSLEDFTAAEKAFLHALDVNPANILSRHNLTLLYLQQGKKQSAEALLEESETKYPNPFTYNILGILAIHKQQYEDARTYFEKGITMCTSNTAIHNDLQKNLSELAILTKKKNKK